jgi:hypothetical protein
MSTLETLPRRLYCYRLYAWSSELDEEEIWLVVQSWGGHIEFRGDCIDYFIPERYISFFVIKYPELTRQPALEYL